ncbi:hypothetical protein FOJ82_14635 [Tessaracoccus rhinocerotis]|uniref:Lipoprotein n=1 Tax=Tessaracoccus rhinocerotis TaxID=1689449 RepID=A0A553JXD1_9ACTN|nr:hypothetical protein [Tessaracoccus rhinocerotis]TRY17080.1 hypothetical protein FOJ82_14635 [Tessaracoccus rhinocerotis]
MRTKKSLAAWLAGLAAVSLFTACSGDDPETPTPDGTQQVETGAPADPGDTNPPPVEGEEGEPQTFEGEVSTETITANMMEMQIPTGLRIPEDALVTQALPTSIMIADADETAVVEMVNASAAEAGYEVFAEIPGGKVFVGHGNAVLFTAYPNAQLITWGPESMKDVLAQG